MDLREDLIEDFKMTELDKVKRAQKKLGEEILLANNPDIRYTSIGMDDVGTYTLRVGVRNKKVIETLPKSVDGYRVIGYETGEIRALKNGDE